MFLAIAGVLAFGVLAIVVKAWLRSQKNKEKSFKNSLLSIALTPARALGVGPYKQKEINLESAMRYAIKKTGLKDFGNMGFVNTYNAVLKSPVQLAQHYSNIGFISSRIEMNMTMVRRLKFIEFLKHHPDVEKTPVRSPVFVMGLPRTGTTFLHRLLCLDPQVRPPLLWELLSPVPFIKDFATASKEAKAADRKKRSDFVRKVLDTRKSMGDSSMEHIHEFGWDFPEECMVALTDELPILLQYLYSSYVSYPLLPEALKDAKNPYLHYRKYLQLMSYEAGDLDPKTIKSWMLKCPIHLMFIPQIKEAFPDAKLIWTHRHPTSAVTSLCSLLKSVHQLSYEPECRDDAMLGKQVSDVSEYFLEKAQTDIEESGLPCSHVLYNELVSDSVGTVRKIYETIGWEFTKEYETILNNYLDANKKDREAIKAKSGGAHLHSYDPQEFGLTMEGLSSGKYANYVDSYHIPLSKTL